jgi:hypothetical protein
MGKLFSGKTMDLLLVGFITATLKAPLLTWPFFDY